MRDYAQALAGFDHDGEIAPLLLAVGGMNAAEICCDRHVGDGTAVALRHVSTDGTVRAWTFAELSAASRTFAQALRSFGVAKGVRVAGLLPRTPELLITILATWRLGAVYQPLFTAFGPTAIGHRVDAADTRVIVTNDAHRAKLEDVEGKVVIVTIGDGRPGDKTFETLFAAVSDDDGGVEAVPCAPDDPFLLMFTSGTTGKPKSLFVPLRAIAAFVAYMRDAVDLRRDDRFWNLADPGWAYGLYYAVTGPLALGAATVFNEAAFDAETTFRTIAELGITNLAGSPTAFRLLIAGGAERAAAVKGQLRAVSSAGEPLNPEVIRWFADNLGVPIHDHYGQTELGMVLCNHHALDHPVRIGTAGYPSPGHQLAVVSDDGDEVPSGTPGILALDRTRSPMMWFGGYREDPARAFSGRYYLTGDTVEANDDGSISFVGRADDVITTSGYRVGPFDVESALLEHEAVSESAVIGKPDAQRTELIKAFVVLAPGHVASDELAEALKRYVKVRLAAHAYPREIAFVADLPKTPSGKVQRFILRRQEIADAADRTTPGAAA